MDIGPNAVLCAEEATVGKTGVAPALRRPPFRQITQLPALCDRGAKLNICNAIPKVWNLSYWFRHKHNEVSLLGSRA